MSFFGIYYANLPTFVPQSRGTVGIIASHDHRHLLIVDMASIQLAKIKMFVKRLPATFLFSSSPRPNGDPVKDSDF